ncbi:MAG: 16S rRNA (guanine(966)-N(2))-methyltransferase RsmD [Firmicutes bacterium]|nr:16S rRNA (guanine(966)-N(2))-methyltransferase RsmD [Bacillota bacterium]
MRVLAGKVRGAKLKSVPGTSTRPTLERVREALFDLLGPNFCVGKRVVDLYAGTGALGIEALSRGARQAIFVEQEPRALAVLKENLAHCGLADLAEIVHGRVFETGRRLQMLGPFDLIFADPPYAQPLFQPLLDWVARSHLLVACGCLVYQQEAPRSEGQLPTPEDPAWQLWKERRYGRTQLVLMHYDGQWETEGVSHDTDADSNLSREF